MQTPNLTANHLGELLAELAPLFTGARLRNLSALPPRDLLLLFERPAPPRLRLSASADGPRIHLEAKRHQTHTGPIGPFYRRVAEELDGARLDQLRQVAGDRIVELVFGSTPSGEKRSLLAELTGRHANLLLLGPAERVLAWLVPPPQHRSGVQPRLVIGEPWSAPPGAGRAAPGGSLLDDLPDPGVPAPEGVAAPLSWRVECTLGAAAVELVLERARKQLLGRLERKLKKARALDVGLERRLAATLGAERVRQDGELLKGHMHALRRGQSSIEVPDLFEPEGPPRTIELDPRRSPQENVERIFERYKKLLRSKQNVEGELELVRERRSALEAFLERARAADSDPAALAEEGHERGLLDRQQVADARRRKPPPARKPYREFTTLAGSAVLVGRSAADNDVLTLRVARGNDLWLHTRDAPGSHVVLRLERGAEPDEEDVLDAAHLAAHFSPLRESTRVAVHLARRKRVHKPKGAKPGLVTLSGGRVVQLRVQPARIQRLLASARRGPPGEGGD
jgi:predicted ribosome quality control (RQC) complex YloA/Tae2 family protein